LIASRAVEEARSREEDGKTGDGRRQEIEGVEDVEGVEGVEGYETQATSGGRREEGTTL
jgi:hypothetical protein